jgi:putative hydrolase of HD superfamily
MQPDIHRLLELQKLLAAFSQVERVAHRNHLGTFIAENDTEHSYNLAITGWFLTQWFPKLDKNKVITYGLVHDLVEVHAGDTYIYASQEEIDSKIEREAAALKKLEKDWADFKDLTQTIQEYERREDAESRFVYALDKIMPIMLIYIHDGYSWKKEGVTAKMLHDAKIHKIKLSPEIQPYFDELYTLLLSRPDLINAS